MIEEFFSQHWLAIVAIAAWTLPWKGVALWRAANLRDKKWFVALLVVNTLGILEILYIFVVSKRSSIHGIWSR